MTARGSRGSVLGLSGNLVQLGVAEVQTNVDGDGEEVEAVRSHRQPVQPVLGLRRESGLADDAEDVADEQEDLKEEALALGRAGGVGLADGNRPRQAEADDHQCFEKVRHDESLLSVY